MKGSVRHYSKSTPSELHFPNTISKFNILKKGTFLIKLSGKVSDGCHSDLE